MLLSLIDCSYLGTPRLMEHYPHAKVILTVRDAEKWYESARDTIYQVAARGKDAADGPPGPPNFPGDPELLMLVMAMVGRDVWEGDFCGRFEEREFAIDLFKRHAEDVKAHVPADRLLVFEVKEGWEPLCQFLGVPVPDDKPFPRLNDRETFQNRLKSGSLEH